MEISFYWRHCHEGKCDVHMFTYLNLIGDGVHNFTEGMGKKKALVFNFICALTAFLGAFFGYAISGIQEGISVFLISFTAGGFIYIAASDFIPELHKQKDMKQANMALAAFMLGIIFMAVAKLFA